MDIVITGRHMALTSELSGFIREKVEKLDRFAERLQSANVIVDLQGDEAHVELVVGGRRGVRFAANAVSTSVHDAVRLVETRVEKQLKKFKERMTSKRPRSMVVDRGSEPATDA